MTINGEGIVNGTINIVCENDESHNTHTATVEPNGFEAHCIKCKALPVPVEYLDLVRVSKYF